MKPIDAEKLKVEIERQQRNLILLSSTEQTSVRRDCALQNGVYEYILSIIDSLLQKQPEVDFETELKNEKTKLLDAFGPMNGEQCLTIRDFARHFYELDKTARKEENK